MTIFLNCIVLAYEDPMVESDPIIEIFDLIFLIIFSVEMVLKIIAFGFVMQPYSYLRDPWNIVSFLSFLQILLLSNIFPMTYSNPTIIIFSDYIKRVDY